MAATAGRGRGRSQDTRLEPFAHKAEDALVADPVAEETEQPVLADRIEEAPNIRVENPVHRSAADRHRQCIQRIVLAPPGPKPIREPEEGQRPISAAMDPRVQVEEVALQPRLVVLPCHAINPGGGTALERQERLPQQINRDVVQQRGELLTLKLPCSVPYTVPPL